VAARDIELSAVRAENAALRGEIEHMTANRQLEGGLLCGGTPGRAASDLDESAEPAAGAAAEEGDSDA
jgi:hypothetical protein